MRDSDSVAVYFLNAMFHALRDQPGVRDAHLRAVGIDPAVLDQPQARVPAKAFAQLWLTQIQLLDDEFFRLDSHGMPLGSFALICRGLIQEPNLDKALRQCLGNFSLFLRDLRGNLTVRAGRAVISVHSDIADPLTRVYAEETYLVLVVGLLCWLAGRRLAIDRTELAVARPAQDDDLLLWGPDLRLGSGRTEVEFDSAYLRLPVVQDLAGLKTFLRSAPQGWSSGFAIRMGWWRRCTGICVPGAMGNGRRWRPWRSGRVSVPVHSVGSWSAKGVRTSRSRMRCGVPWRSSGCARG